MIRFAVNLKDPATVESAMHRIIVALTGFVGRAFGVPADPKGGAPAYRFIFPAAPEARARMAPRRYAAGSRSKR